MTTVQLANLDARLIYLALQYHLARPGSELDPETKEPVAAGLSSVAAALEPQIDHAVTTIDLTDHQRARLLAAIAGTINELKAYSFMSEGGRSASPAFESTLKRLFPAVAEEPDEATSLAGHMIALRRRIEQLRVEDEAQSQPAARAPRWQFWRRS